MSARLLFVLPLFLLSFAADADLYSILYEAGMPWLDANFTSEDIHAQERLFPSVLPGEEALKIALQTFLYESGNAKSPLLIAGSKEKLLVLLNRYDAKLYLVSPDDEDHKPQWGESVDANWIFCLYLPRLSDHLYWAVVDRRGVKDPYAYGFN